MQRKTLLLAALAALVLASAAAAEPRGDDLGDRGSSHGREDRSRHRGRPWIGRGPDYPSPDGSNGHGRHPAPPGYGGSWYGDWYSGGVRPPPPPSPPPGRHNGLWYY